MKARVKATGEIVEVDYIEGDYLHTSDGLYLIAELEGIESDIDCWTRLEHQAAIAAMQGLLNNNLLSSVLFKKGTTHEDYTNEVVKVAKEYAHALVEKMKEERK